MRNSSKLYTVTVVLLLAISIVSNLFAEQGSVNKPSKEEIFEKTQSLQIPFIANNGQTDERVMFYANTFGGTVFVTRDGEVVYSLPKYEEERSVVPDKHDQVTDEYSYAGNQSKSELQILQSNGLVLKEVFVGGKIRNLKQINEIKGEERAITKVNYFRGKAPLAWNEYDGNAAALAAGLKVAAVYRTGDLLEVVH